MSKRHGTAPIATTLIPRYTDQSSPPEPIHNYSYSYWVALSRRFTLRIQISPPPDVNVTQLSRPQSIATETKKRYLPTSQISAGECIDSQSMLFSFSLPNWVPTAPLTDLSAWSSRVASNKSKSKLSSDDILVRAEVPLANCTTSNKVYLAVEYVTCKICKSPDTLLSKENRLYFMTCESCGSRRSVSAIKTGFQAQVGKRKLTKPQT